MSELASDHGAALDAVTPAPTPGRKLGVPLALGTVYLVWGSTYLALRWVVEAFPPMLAAGGRYLLAGLVLLTFARLRGAVVTRRDWLRAAPIGALLFVVGNGFVSLAEREVSSTQAAIVCAAMPLVTVVFGAFASERPRPQEVVGLLCGFAGVVVLTASALGHATGATLLLLCAPIGWAAGTVLARRRGGPGGIAGAALPMIWGGVGALVFGLLHGEGLPREPPPLRAIAALVYLVVAGSMIAFSAYSYLLRHTRQSVATSYAYVNPVVATVLGAALGGEKLTGHTLLGGGLVVAGVTLVIVGKRGPSAEERAKR